MKNRVLSKILIASLVSALLSCADPGGGDSETSAQNEPAGPFIYVASGTTYAGNGVTMGAPVNAVVRFLIDGTFDRVIMDYTASPGDSPVGMIDYDEDHLLVLIENTSGRRIELVAKDGSGAATYLTNSTALSAVVRALIGTSDGGLLVSKSTAIEKFSSAKSRVTSGANPYISAPAAPCATSTTLTSSLAIGPSDVIIMAHAAASPNNQFNLIKSTGYTVAGDCVTAQDGPTANHWPTSLLMHSSGKLLVGYGNNTGPVHQIYSYAVTSTTVSAATLAYNNTSILQGITSIAEMLDGTVLVSAGASTFNTIEKFSFDSGSGLLTRVGSGPFIGPNLFTRSVSAIVVSD